ncbi:MAG: hypothetical protein JXD22_16480 [Sedimentisphaerales bacterium]|nr:hypothetical protein [Sedimentisphaerales bacterium]
MSDSWVMVGNKVDSLWLEQIPSWLNSALDGTNVANIKIIRLLDLCQDSGFPHYHNVLGWRNLFIGKGIRQVHLIMPADKVFGIIIAAALANVEVNLHLTEQLNRAFFTGLKCPGIKMKRFFCVADFIARQLISHGIQPNRIRSVEPKIETTVISRNQLDKIRQSIQPHADGPLILALQYPDNTQNLKQLIWAGAIVKHIINPLKIVITGKFTAENQKKLLSWQKEMDAPNMLYLDNNKIGWNALSQTADLVAGAGSNLREIGRLLYVRTGQTPILTGSESGHLPEQRQHPEPVQEILQNSNNVHYVKKNTPRRLATKMLELLENQR